MKLALRFSPAILLALLATTACQEEAPVTRIPADAKPFRIPSLAVQVGTIQSDVTFQDSVKTPVGEVFAKINLKGDRCETRGGPVRGTLDGNSLSFVAKLQNCPGDFVGQVDITTGDGKGTVANVTVVLSRL